MDKPKTKTYFYDPRPGSRIFLFICLWLAAALPELVVHIAASKNDGTLWSAGLILAPMFALVPALIVFALCLVIPGEKVRFGITVGYSAVLFLFFACQLVYVKVFGTFFTFYSMQNGTDALQFTNTIFTAIGKNLLWLLAMALPLVFFIGWGRKLLGLRWRSSWKAGLAAAAVCVLVHAGCVTSLPLFGNVPGVSPQSLYHSTSDIYTSVNKLGLFTAFRLDLTRHFSDDDSSGSIILETIAPTIPETTAPAVPESVPTETTEPAPTEPPIEYNVLDIDFDALIAQSESSAVTELHQYFASRTPTVKNEKTGIFAGKNLILITAEAFSHLAVDPERTPTLYMMMTQGFQFTNYYVPDWGVSTTDGEYAFLTGTIPKEGVWSFAESAENYMPLTMSQQLLNQGYSAYGYHGHTYNYYHRDSYLENLGYLYKAYGKGLDVTWQWPESDVEVVDLSTGDYVNQQPFTAYYMSISGHREFNFYGNSMSAKNYDLVKDEPYSENVRAYLACQMELEMAMTLLLERLEEAGVLENTVIVLTADHYPNGLTFSEMGELLGHTPEGNFEVYRNGCILYTPGMTPEVIDTPTSHLDLLPTLSNLFGLEFDSRLYMGRDVFSDAEGFVCFRNRSWITEQAMYHAETGQVTNLTDTPVTDDYVTAMHNAVNNRFAVSSRILDYDYWRLLFGE